MDCGSRFFYALEKTRGAKKHVTCLLAEDSTPLTEPAEMCGRARAFYAHLFSPDPTDPSACRVLWEELPMVIASDRDWLQLPLTLAKFWKALRRMPTNKSPSMEGLTVEFYRVFWNILGPDLVTIWAESLQSGVLSLSCRRAVLALLLKKGDLRDLQNWRPVSFLSTDYKIVAKAISLRLGSMLVDVIHPDQTYTVLDRSIFDNLFMVRDLLELGRRDGLSFALLSLDQEKAFDRVDHGYLLSTLQVNWVKNSGLAVGDWRQASSLPPALQTIRWSVGPLLYLSIYLSTTHPSPPENWENLEGGVIVAPEMDRTTPMSLPRRESAGA
ncbi:unnamed protein product [Caretta caretta]